MPARKCPLSHLPETLQLNPSQAADSGRYIIKGDTKIAVPAGRDAVEFGRS